MNNLYIPRSPMASSCVASAGYAEAFLALDVEYRSGALYRYCFVPRAVYEGLLAAASKGAYLNHYIKGRYPEALLSPAAARPAQMKPSSRRSLWTEPLPLQGHGSGRRS